MLEAPWWPNALLQDNPSIAPHGGYLNITKAYKDEDSPGVPVCVYNINPKYVSTFWYELSCVWQNCSVKLSCAPYRFVYEVGLVLLLFRFQVQNLLLCKQ